MKNQRKLKFNKNKLHKSRLNNRWKSQERKLFNRQHTKLQKNLKNWRKMILKTNLRKDRLLLAHQRKLLQLKLAADTLHLMEVLILKINQIKQLSKVRLIRQTLWMVTLIILKVQKVIYRLVILHLKLILSQETE